MIIIIYVLSSVIVGLILGILIENHQQAKQELRRKSRLLVDLDSHLENYRKQKLKKWHGTEEEEEEEEVMEIPINQVHELGAEPGEREGAEGGHSQEVE